MSARGVAQRTMRAAVLASPGCLELRERPIPAPTSGEVLVRLEGSGVCASNLAVWAGQPWFDYPLPAGAPGHEGWGVVDAVGSAVAEVAEGDRVALLSQSAYAEYDMVSADQIVPLPPGLDGAAFPGEPLGCAMNIFRRSGVAAGQTIAVVGIGFLGALLTQLASGVGARVIAVSRRDLSLSVGTAMGAAAAVPLQDPSSTVDEVRELTGGELCDVVIEATGKQSPLDLAAKLTRVRGRLVIAGYHQDGPRQVDMQLWNWRGLDVINAHERDPAVYRQGMREAVEAIVSGRLDPALLYTHRYPLERLDEALDATRDRPDGFLKALVTV
ncbi:zinc-binding dehydrogenase [soil metagenome]